MKRPNLRIVVVAGGRGGKGEETKVKGIESMFHRIIDFHSLKKEMSMEIKEAYRTANRQDQKSNSLAHNTQNTHYAEQSNDAKSCKTTRPSHT